jgi:hypothetical protein
MNNKFYFSLPNVTIVSEYGSKDVPDAEYSCLWNLVDCGGEKIPLADHTSAKRQVWKNNKQEWVAAQLDAPYWPLIEELILNFIEDEELRVTELNLEEA